VGDVSVWVDVGAVVEYMSRRLWLVDGGVHFVRLRHVEGVRCFYLGAWRC
jgi:hypothetical protein